MKKAKVYQSPKLAVQSFSEGEILTDFLTDSFQTQDYDLIGGQWW